MGFGCDVLVLVEMGFCPSSWLFVAAVWVMSQFPVVHYIVLSFVNCMCVLFSRQLWLAGSSDDYKDCEIDGL